MDEKLKDAIVAVRSGDVQEAQQQLTELLAENPEEAQGWYLLSLLVDSPQKQAAFLSKTLALNPQHEKAQEQLSALQRVGSLAPTTTISDAPSQPMDVLAQSETDTLPSWLQEAGGTSTDAQPAVDIADAAEADDTLPDWLKEPSTLGGDATLSPVEELSTVTSQSAKTSKMDQAGAAGKIKPAQARKKPAKTTTSTSKSTTGLNVILGILVILAVIVMVLLAYLILG